MTGWITGIIPSKRTYQVKQSIHGRLMAENALAGVVTPSSAFFGHFSNLLRRRRCNFAEWLKVVAYGLRGLKPLIWKNSCFKDLRKLCHLISRKWIYLNMIRYRGGVSFKCLTCFGTVKEMICNFKPCYQDIGSGDQLTFMENFPCLEDHWRNLYN